MVFTWYLIFNLDEFEETGLVSKKYPVILQGLGLKNILVTKGNLISMVFDDVFLSANLNELNPFVFDGHAIFIDSQNDVYLGVEVQ